jgi:hypothetical protein
MTNMLKRTPSKKTATKSQRSLLRQEGRAAGEGMGTGVWLAEFCGGVLDSASVCETEPTVRGLLLKTASLFIK